MKKILVVIGTRPEAIKIAPVIIALQKKTSSFETVVCSTGQHRELLDQVLEVFSIKPDIDLKIMKAGQDLTDVTVRVLEGIKEVLLRENPDIVLVHGDTTTSMAASLASFYLHIPVGHVEAGLRTYDKYSPWPEEINRQITDRIATYHFAPTELNKQNLLKEGVSFDRIYVTGNTVIDALHYAVKRIEGDPELKEGVHSSLTVAGLDESKLVKWDGADGLRRMILITGHRRENFGEGFINICEAIKALAKQYPGVDFVYPMHLNPNVREAIEKVFGKLKNDHSGNIYFIEPLQYLPFIYLMKKCYLVLTDSGGIQEEAPSLGKPVLVMRDTTERQEAVESGTVRLIGTNREQIINGVINLFKHSEYRKMAEAVNPFGDGKSAGRIVDRLED